MPDDMLVKTIDPQILSGVCCQFSGLFDPSVYNFSLTPLEMEVVLPTSLSHAVAKRQAEFIAGRYAARAALRAAGYAAPIEIGIRPDRSPEWPGGFIGTITHTKGYVSAAVARTDDLMALGRDSENLLDERIASEIKDTTLSSKEISLQHSSGLDLPTYTGVIFSAKESVYKALAPVVLKYFSFEDAQVIEVRKSGHIRFRLKKDLSPRFLAGHEIVARFVIDAFIHTSVEIPRATSLI